MAGGPYNNPMGGAPMGMPPNGAPMGGPGMSGQQQMQPPDKFFGLPRSF